MLRLNRTRLINEMASRELNPADLARACDLSDATISLLFKCNMFGSFKTLGKIAKALNVKPSELLIEQEPPQV